MESRRAIDTELSLPIKATERSADSCKLILSLQRTMFTPERIAIEKLDGTLFAERGLALTK